LHFQSATNYVADFCPSQNTMLYMAASTGLKTEFHYISEVCLFKSEQIFLQIDGFSCWIVKLEDLQSLFTPLMQQLTTHHHFIHTTTKLTDIESKISHLSRWINCEVILEFVQNLLQLVESLVWGLFCVKTGHSPNQPLEWSLKHEQLTTPNQLICQVPSTSQLHVWVHAQQDGKHVNHQRGLKETNGKVPEWTNFKTK